MNIKRITAITAASVVWVGTFGLLGNAEANAASYTHTTVITLTPDMPLYHTISQCNDGLPVYIASDGVIYGDQESDGVLSGIDCDWT